MFKIVFKNAKFNKFDINYKSYVTAILLNHYKSNIISEKITRNARFYSDFKNSSIDFDEIKKFKFLSNSWWIENGAFEALHKMNNLRVPLIRDTMISYRQSLSHRTEENQLKKSNFTSNEIDNQNKKDEHFSSEPLSGLNILDIGCGGGLLSEPLARLGANVTGIDACKENINVAQLRAETQYEKSNGSLKFYERIRYYNCLLEELAGVEDNHNYFDGIVMSEVLEHVNNLDDFLYNSSKLLKNNGYTFITTINRTKESYLLAIIGAEYLFNLVPKGTHNWNKFILPEEIKCSLEKYQVYLKFKMGMTYNPIKKVWSWSENETVNYAICAQKFESNH